MKKINEMTYREYSDYLNQMVAENADKYRKMNGNLEYNREEVLEQIGIPYVEKWLRKKKLDALKKVE